MKKDFFTEINCFTETKKDSDVPIIIKDKNSLKEMLATCNPVILNALNQSRFMEGKEKVFLFRDQNGYLEKVFVKDSYACDMWILGTLTETLPTSVNYYLDISDDAPKDLVKKYLFGWALGGYKFCRYKKADSKNVKLVWPNSVDSKSILTIIEGIYLIRDLINVPACDMGPQDLADVASYLAEKFQAKFTKYDDPKILAKKFPGTLAVGQGSARSPLVIDIRWGNDENLPLVTLIGKGVCFDSGGLDLKPSKFMRHMKADMAGAAHVLGLSYMIMNMNLAVNLRLLIPVVDNMLANNSLRPGDIIKMQNKKSVEIENTDAEGRLILADVLSEACFAKPDLLIDIATLTGAARVALGSEISALFSNSSKLALDICAISKDEEDPIAQLPLYKPYLSLLKSDIADMKNCSDQLYGGAITAALFLSKFVSKECNWLHFDIMAMNEKALPGRPVGGEAQAVRALFSYLYNNFPPHN